MNNHHISRRDLLKLAFVGTAALAGCSQAPKLDPNERISLSEITFLPTTQDAEPCTFIIPQDKIRTFDKQNPFHDFYKFELGKGSFMTRHQSLCRVKNYIGARSEITPIKDLPHPSDAFASYPHESRGSCDLLQVTMLNPENLTPEKLILIDDDHRVSFKAEKATPNQGASFHMALPSISLSKYPVEVARPMGYLLALERFEGNSAWRTPESSLPTREEELEARRKAFANPCPPLPHQKRMPAQETSTPDASKSSDSLVK